MRKSKILTGILILLNYYFIFKYPLPANLDIVSSKYLALSTVVSLRLVTFTLLLISSSLLSKKIPYFTLVLLCLPWSLHIYNFEVWQTVIVSMVIICLYLELSAKAYAKFFVVITIACYLIYVVGLINNPNYHLFLGKLKPANLTLEINEEQKIEFLATNKQYLLPALVRKFAHNKPLYALKYSFDQLVGYFDIEQWSLPIYAYSILELSGIPPKPVVLMLAAWQIPVILYSLFFIKKYKKIILVGFLGSIFTYFIFEKKYLSVSAFLILPFLTIALANAINSSKNGFVRKTLIMIVFTSSIFTSTNYYKMASKRYTTDLFYYQKIAEQLALGRNDKFWVTDKFGPADLFLKYYLKDNLTNIKIGSFAFTDNNPELDTTYIGFPAEFTGLHKESLDSLPANSKFLGEIEGEDQIVSNFGNKLWVVKVN